MRLTALGATSLGAQGATSLGALDASSLADVLTSPYTNGILLPLSEALGFIPRDLLRNEYEGAINMGVKANTALLHAEDRWQVLSDAFDALIPPDDLRASMEDSLKSVPIERRSCLEAIDRSTLQYVEDQYRSLSALVEDVRMQRQLTRVGQADALRANANQKQVYAQWQDASQKADELEKHANQGLSATEQAIERALAAQWRAKADVFAAELAAVGKALDLLPVTLKFPDLGEAVTRGSDAIAGQRAAVDAAKRALLLAPVATGDPEMGLPPSSSEQTAYTNASANYQSFLESTVKHQAASQSQVAALVYHIRALIPTASWGPVPSR